MGWNTWFRKRRMRRFVRELEITAETRVLDVGGTPETWDTVVDAAAGHAAEYAADEKRTGGRAWWVAGDGRALPFRDGAFDVVFSNSVIEHVGDAESQSRFAREVARVGRAYWVQTPNRWFPVEQHLLTPLVHWLPKSVAAADRAAVYGMERAGAPRRGPAGILPGALSERSAPA